ncbi:MAG: M48 family metalloprotease [Pseudomonadales bacterium]
MNFSNIRNLLILLIYSLALSGCVTNPVTGQSEVGFVSMEQQIAIGEQQYLPAQQMQGGAYRVDPELTDYVSSVGHRVAAYSNIDLPYEFVVLNSSVPNAWALPGGKLAINRGLLVALRNEAELAAVLGHEVTHAAARHGAKQIERGYLLQGALLATAIGVQGSALGNSIMQSAQMAATLVNTKYGRDAERESDFYGTRMMAQAGYDPYAAVTLQETFLKLSEGRDPSWVEGLLASHPPSAERVSNNRSLVEKLRSEGFTSGEYASDRYQAATRQLRADKDAYANADDARKAFNDGDLTTALSLVEKAIDAQGAEPTFHALRGQIRYEQKRYDDAVTNFNRAIERDDAFYGHYLGRGMTYVKLKDQARAKADLNASVELLPTTIAYLELGKIAEAEGNTDLAARYYQAAGQSEGPVGEEARARLARLSRR